MKFLIISRHGEGLQIAMKLAEEGHASKLFVCDGSMIGENLAELSEEKDRIEFSQARSPALRARLIQTIATKDTIIVFTCGGYGIVADLLRSQGYLVFGAGKFHDALQFDADFIRTFCNVNEISYQKVGKGVPSVILGWFNGEDFVFPILGAVQEFQFMAGDVGPTIECAGVSGFAYKTFKTQLFQETLGKTKDALTKLDYKGPIGADLIEDSVVRFTCSFRFDLTHLFIGLLDQSLGKLLVDTARGLVNQIKVRHEYGVGVRVSGYPYPHAIVKPSDIQVAPIEVIKEGFVPTGVRLVKDEGILTAASLDGQLFCATGYGPSIKEAQAQAFKIIGRYYVPGMQFRVDIGAKALQTIGHILQWTREFSIKEEVVRA